MRKVSAIHRFGLASYVNKIYHYHTEMIIFFHGFISNNEALDMSVFPGMIYNRHRPALIKHCEARMLFGLYQQDGVPLGKRGMTSLDSTTLRNDECTA